ncbi:MAG: excinuclease ABC subunit UvrA [Bifidobacteriaceae bacterium]|jgi:excinuclease ABC subunit A|nr:excinuclease ABC subunit UvrA [Bifidobacteriaceae bacterium]
MVAKAEANPKLLKDCISIKGARVHNLKNINLSIPRNSLNVFTGLSGSGKSSLAFDTIFAEGQRRFVESLSAYARQFLGQMDKPDIDFIEGLSPAVSIDQKSTNKNPRSTVGTITEIYDYLRLLFARVGIQHCPKCDAKVESQTPGQMADAIFELDEGTKFLVLAPVIRDRKGEYQDLFDNLKKQGFVRVRVDGEILQLADKIVLEKNLRHNIEVVVDRLVVDKSSKSRLVDSIETSLNVANNLMSVQIVSNLDKAPYEFRNFSAVRACPNGHELSLTDIEPRTFSFNAPYGACPECDGIGKKSEIDPDLVVTDMNLPALDGGLIQSMGISGQYFKRILDELSFELDFDLSAPLKALDKKQLNAILFGYNFKVYDEWRDQWGGLRRKTSGFEGVVPMMQRRYDETDSSYARFRYESIMREAPCPLCKGARLKDDVLAVRIKNLNIYNICELSIDDLSKWIKDLNLKGSSAKIGAQVIQEISTRVDFLLNVGLNYLTLARSAATLSGGEAQRIRLATQIGSGLVGVLYVLDEPSIGLHQRDNFRLIRALQHLRDLGNTLIVVEHDEETLKHSNWITDIGPLAGEAGGEVVYNGPFKNFKNVKNSLTSDYLNGKKKIEIPKKRRKISKSKTLKIVGAKENNLQNIGVSFPLGVFICITGVSGSGKSSLVDMIVYRELANKLNGAKMVAGKHKKIEGLKHLDKVIHVDQSPIGRTPRSNPATYTKVWDKIRVLLSETQLSKQRGYKPGRFSFNVPGGRCEACSGDGTIKIEMNFLSDVYVICEVCKGKRYNDETLEVKYKGKNVADILDMEIEKACEFFDNIPFIVRYLKTLNDVGLGYLKLGQSSVTLSGGESQRVKLATELQRPSTGNTFYILDEPTTGLHFEDIKKLLLVLQGLVDKGNTVAVIEHNLDVIKSADYLIDLGPEGGIGGGKIVALGSPEEVAKNEKSFTGQFLKKVL